MARNSISNDEALGWVMFGLIVIGIILAILAAIIMLFRFFFWVSVVLFFCSLVFFIVSIFLDISRCREEDYFDGIPWALLAIGCIILFWVTAHFTFAIGYGETAQGVIKLNDQYKKFMGDIEEPQNQMNLSTHQALNESCRNLPNSSGCDLSEGGLNAYDSVGNIEDTVDFITRLFYLRNLI